MKDYISFVYLKDGLIKVLTHEEALQQEKGLLESGWKHTSTINPNTFIQNAFNSNKLTEELVKFLTTN